MLEKIQVLEPVSLKELRGLTGLSQEEFSKEVGIPLTSYRRYEANPRSMDVGKLLSICDKVGVPIENIDVRK